MTTASLWRFKSSTLLSKLKMSYTHTTYHACSIVWLLFKLNIFKIVCITGCCTEISLWPHNNCSMLMGNISLWFLVFATITFLNILSHYCSNDLRRPSLKGNSIFFLLKSKTIDLSSAESVSKNY